MDSESSVLGLVTHDRNVLMEIIISPIHMSTFANHRKCYRKESCCKTDCVTLIHKIRLKHFLIKIEKIYIFKCLNLIDVTKSRVHMKTL